MGLFGRFGKRDVVSSEMVVGLTNLGKQKAEQFSVSGPKFEVMAVLNERGPCTIKELGEETRMDISKIKFIVKALVRSQCVRVQRGEEVAPA